MSRMGMLKTAISGRFGNILGESPSHPIDVGAKKPDIPNHNTPTKRDKKEKRSKGGVPTEIKSSPGPAPAIFHKPERQELKHGHDPNKVNGVGLSTRHIVVEPSKRHMNYQPSTRNLGTFEPSTTTPNTMSSPKKSMRHIDKKSSMRNMNSNSVDKNISMRYTNGGFDKKNTSSRNVEVNNNLHFDKKMSLRHMNLGSIDESSSSTPINSNGLGSIDENSSRNTNQKQTTGSSSSTTNKGSGSSTSSKTPSSSTNTNGNGNINGSINGKTPGGSATFRPPSSSNSNSSSKSKNSVSTSTKSTTSTSTKSTESTSSKSIVSINNKSNQSNYSDGLNNKSNHSLSTAKSDKTRNVDNRNGKVRPKPPRKRGPSLVTPVHINRDRPSTVLITRKELEEILAEKVKEEMMEKKSMPPKSGTLSTDLWLDAANKEPQSEEFSVASGTSMEEESPFGKSSGNPVEMGEEYDINFFTDIIEEEEEIEEITEHTINSGHNSFEANELELAESMERRFTTIRFDEYDELQTCLHINDYTKGEVSRSWYRRDDYDKMVDLARKTASKAVKREKELQEELQTMLRVSVSPPRAGRRNGELREDGGTDGDNRSVGTDGSKKMKPIEYRGLEAWTPEGSQKCRTLKENAIELVWSEQSRQWEEGTFDPDAISEVYRPVSKIAIKHAHERALGDEKMVKKLADQAEVRAMKKKLRNKSMAAIKKSAAVVGRGAGKVLTETGKGAVKITKRGVKAGVATATLDPKMMKEALKVRMHGKKKRECKHEMEITTSKAAVERDIEELEESGSITIDDSKGFLFNSTNPMDRRAAMQKPGLPRPGLATTYEFSDMASDKISDDLSSANGNASFAHSDLRDLSSRNGDSASNVSSTSPKKKSKLKLLGIVPIPGTTKKYSEDRREARVEKRQATMNRIPSWEGGMSGGKY